MSSSVLSFFVTANPPARLDKALSRDAPDSASLSRSRIRKLIEKGVVRVDEIVATHLDASVCEGQFIEITLPQIEDIDNAPENIPLNIVYEDDSLQYIDSERIRYITPTFNNSSKLEFDIQPNNSYSDLCQSRLKFMVDIPLELIPDSYFTSKLFEHLEVRLI